MLGMCDSTIALIQDRIDTRRQSPRGLMAIVNVVAHRDGPVTRPDAELAHAIGLELELDSQFTSSIDLSKT